MAAYDPKDDVDRLFACFKCGVSPPQSAFRERPRRAGKKSWVATAVESGCGGGSSSSAPTPDAAEKHVAPSSAAIKFTGRKQMSPIVFYGSPQGVPVKKPLGVLMLLREIRIDLKKQTDLIPRDVVWATFPRQEEAIRFSKAHVHTNVFSYQDHWSGQRRFLVSTYSEFWRRYNNKDPNIRHHYEVIQEGSPCHIYFDLEFDKRLNKKSDADEMVDILVAVTFSALYEKYSIEGHEEWIIELDSSTEEKFSRHLIIRIPKIAFKDNSHVGSFISEVCLRIAAQRTANRNLDKLYITKDSSCADPIVMLIVDFQKAAYYQKCYDPDCQGYRSPLRAVPWDVIPELSSIVDSAQTEYQGEVVEFNTEDSNRNEYLPDGKSVTESGEEDPRWWEEAVKFADSIENIDHPHGG